MYVILDTLRESYGVDEVSTMTVGELIDCLQEFDEDAKIYLSFDRGYTYGGIHPYSFSDVYDDEDEVEE